MSSVCTHSHCGNLNKCTAPGDTLTAFFSDTGSTPVSSTIQFVLEPDSLRKRVRVRFLFIGNSAEGLLGTVNRNEQRQGIIVVMVSCLLFCRIKVALCELDRHLYGALMAIASYVHTGSLYTSGKA